jgi:hypothetical protein
MFDFPASPTLGATYQVGGKSYVYDGEKWRNAPSSMPPAKTAQARNHILNPSGQVNQELGYNVGTAVSGGYCADQWVLSFNVTGGAVTAFSTNSLAPTPKGSKYALQTYVTTALPSLPAGSWYGIYQPLEGHNIGDFHWGYANSLPVVLRFSAFATRAGSYAVALRNSPYSHTFCALYTIPANQWTEIIVLIPPPPVTGTWAVDNTKAMELWFTFAAATNQLGNPGWSTLNAIGCAGTSNGMDAVNNNFYIADVGLYLDPLNTGVPPAFELPNIGDELQRCSRYYEIISADVRWDQALTVGVSTGFVFRYVWKRTTPTVAAKSQALSGWTVNAYESVRTDSVTINLSPSAAGPVARSAYTVLAVNARM